MRCDRPHDQFLLMDWKLNLVQLAKFLHLEIKLNHNDEIISKLF